MEIVPLEKVLLQKEVFLKKIEDQYLSALEYIKNERALFEKEINQIALLKDIDNRVQLCNKIFELTNTCTQELIEALTFRRNGRISLYQEGCDFLENYLYPQLAIIYDKIFLSKKKKISYSEEYAQLIKKMQNNLQSLEVSSEEDFEEFKENLKNMFSGCKKLL